MNLDVSGMDAQADEIFDRALDLPAAERAAFVAEQCGNDAELHAKVERLLAWSADPPSMLDAGPRASELWQDDVAEGEEGESEGLPGRLGPYRVVREIGRGGMGVVYLAERADGHFQQQVAVKVMRPGSDTQEARRRFEQERQIIASLQHAGIARLYDGGVTEDGRPFSAMEYVEGRPIDIYCDEERLGLEERLRLLEVVGGAVHYAHQNLVVHRDLKPSNILVTDQGEIKLLDFGIAKLLDVTGDTGLLTRTGGMPVTPLYASPEQLLGEPVTTASDIYQLGLLLFELLSGERARETSGSSSQPSEPHSSIFQTAPTVIPSTAVRRMPAERAAAVADARRTTPRGLVRALRSDLDLIVQAAMRPEPARRYPSAAELSEDLRRHRCGEALTVRADSFGIRARGFLRRHRLEAMIAALFVLLLLAYSVTVTVQAHRISRERDRAERIQTFALGLYGAGDPNEALGPQVTAAELIAHGVARADAELAEEPDVQAEVKTYFANVYLRLGRYQEAEGLFREVLSLRKSLHGEEHPDVASAQDDLARLLLERDDPEALGLLEDALQQRRRFLGEDHVDTARSLVTLGRYLRSVGRLREAEEVMQQGLDIYCRDDHRGSDCADALAELAWVMSLSDRPEEAERLLRQNLDINLHLHGDRHPEVATAWNNLASTLWQLELWGEGDDAMEESFAVMTVLYGAQHPDIATSLGNQAGSLRKRGDLARSAEGFRKSREMRIDLFGARHVRVAEATALFAEVLHDAGRLDEAEPLFEESLSIFQEHLPADHPSFGRLWRGLGSLRLDAGELDGARQALEASRQVYAGMENSSWTARLDVWLARIDRLQGRSGEADRRLMSAEARLQDDPEWLERLREERSALGD